MMTLTLAEYRKKVLGCWMGKNIGGTLGGPYEGKQEAFDIDFYTHDITGDPLPNDDLDLQLVWLHGLERYGTSLNASILGELWHNYITADWVEYGAGKNNMRMGIQPPLSGYVNNVFRDSNGAWIRSEIWACVAPGHPDIAVRYAYEDAIVDHSHEGLYAEVFCAALQSAAFAESNVEKLIQIGLSYIPPDCGVAKGVQTALESFHAGDTWREARKKVLTAVPGSFLYVDRAAPGFVKDVPVGPTGWDAPGNIGIVVIGLCYGGGDMGKSVCIATGCGEDTDCTAGTVGSILGIIAGIDNIPERWIKPIGHGIKTMCLNLTDWVFFAPKTIEELTERVLKVTPQILGGDKCDYIHAERGYDVHMKEGDQLFCPPVRDRQNGQWYWHDFTDLLSQSPFCIRQDFVIFNTVLDYGGAMFIQQGETKTFRLRIENNIRRQQWLNIKWHVPPAFTVRPGLQTSLPMEAYHGGNLGWVERTFTLTAEELESPRYDLLIEITSQGRHTKGIIPIVLINGL
jgi:ADP-ribosylglycohydrolase